MIGVDQATADWESGTATVTHLAEIDADSLKRAVASASHDTHHDYSVLQVASWDPG